MLLAAWRVGVACELAGAWERGGSVRCAHPERPWARASGSAARPSQLCSDTNMINT